MLAAARAWGHHLRCGASELKRSVLGSHTLVFTGEKLVFAAGSCTQRKDTRIKERGSKAEVPSVI